MPLRAVRRRHDEKLSHGARGAHLRHRRPCEGCLDRGLCQHHDAAEQRRKSSDECERSKDTRSGEHDVGKADEEEASGIDDACMEKG